MSSAPQIAIDAGAAMVLIARSAADSDPDERAAVSVALSRYAEAMRKLTAHARKMGRPDLAAAMVGPDDQGCKGPEILAELLTRADSAEHLQRLVDGFRGESDLVDRPAGN